MALSALRRRPRAGNHPPPAAPPLPSTCSGQTLNQEGSSALLPSLAGEGCPPFQTSCATQRVCHRQILDLKKIVTGQEPKNQKAPPQRSQRSRRQNPCGRFPLGLCTLRGGSISLRYSNQVMMSSRNRWKTVLPKAVAAAMFLGCILDGGAGTQQKNSIM